VSPSIDAGGGTREGDDVRDAQFAPQREWSEELGVKGSWVGQSIAVPGAPRTFGVEATGTF
jgi:hypothetical protein